jgi:predicted MFS family arabinose efflux permease
MSCSQASLSKLQGEISGLSRSVSNLGSSFGTAIAGKILVSDLASGNGTYVAAMIVLAGLGLIGLAAAALLPRNPTHGEQAIDVSALEVKAGGPPAVAG